MFLKLVCRIYFPTCSDDGVNMKIKKILLFLIVFWCGVCCASDLYPFSNSQQEQRFNRLITQFRCLVCQNEDLASSNAALAGDLRKQVYDQVIQGKTDEDIKQYMVHRYGDFILFSPPFNWRSWLLWMGPFVLLIMGLFIIYRICRK